MDSRTEACGRNQESQCKGQEPRRVTPLRAHPPNTPRLPWVAARAYSHEPKTICARDWHGCGADRVGGRRSDFRQQATRRVLVLKIPSCAPITSGALYAGYLIMPGEIARCTAIHRRSVILMAGAYTQVEAHIMAPGDTTPISRRTIRQH